MASKFYFPLISLFKKKVGSTKYYKSLGNLEPESNEVKNENISMVHGDIVANFRRHCQSKQ